VTLAVRAAAARAAAGLEAVGWEVGEGVAVEAVGLAAAETAAKGVVGVGWAVAAAKGDGTAAAASERGGVEAYSAQDKAPHFLRRLCDRRVSQRRSSSDGIDSSRTLCSSSGMPRVKCIRTRELLEGERPPSLLKHGLQSVQQRPDALSVLLEGELARGGIAQHVRVHASRGRVARAIHRQRFDGRAVRREVRVVTARVTVAAVVEQREGREGAEELRAGGGRGGRGGTKGARGRSGWARWWD